MNPQTFNTIDTETVGVRDTKLLVFCTHGYTDRQADSSTPSKTFVLWGYDDIITAKFIFSLVMKRIN